MKIKLRRHCLPIEHRLIIGKGRKPRYPLTPGWVKVVWGVLFVGSYKMEAPEAGIEPAATRYICSILRFKSRALCRLSYPGSCVTLWLSQQIQIYPSSFSKGTRVQMQHQLSTVCGRGCDTVRKNEKMWWKYKGYIRNGSSTQTHACICDDHNKIFVLFISWYPCNSHIHGGVLSSKLNCAGFASTK
jgi:hypothetical protein